MKTLFKILFIDNLNIGSYLRDTLIAAIRLRSNTHCGGVQWTCSIGSWKR